MSFNILNPIQRKQTPLPGVWAVVVSYCGGARLANTVSALLSQVDHVHIVDNASTGETIQALECLALMREVSVSRLSCNMGIGYALNRGIEFAGESGAHWVLTMDQDSIADENLLQSYADAIRISPSLKCLAPNFLNFGTGILKEDADIDFAITSGNLVRIDLMQQIGGFDEGFFIDGVDIDFSLRIRSADAKIRRIGAAVLHHELGHKHPASGFLAKFYTAHPPSRRFYMFRNHIILMRRYALRYPLFIAKATIVQLLYLLAIVRFEGVGSKSLISIFDGIMAGLAGRTGRYK